MVLSSFTCHWVAYSCKFISLQQFEKAHYLIDSDKSARIRLMLCWRIWTTLLEWNTDRIRSKITSKHGQGLVQNFWVSLKFHKKIWTRSSHNADYQLWNICSNRSKDFGETSSGREQKQYKSFRSRFLFDQHHIETKAKNKPDIEAGKSYIDTHSSYGNAKSYFHTDPFSRSV